MTKIVNLSEARSKLSRLIDEAAAGEEIVIARNGVPQAKLVPLPVELKPRKPVNAMKITWIAPDFDVPDAGLRRLFGD